MKSKNKVIMMFQKFHKMITQYQAQIKAFRIYNGGEFANQALRQYINLQGMIHKTNCPYSP